MNTPSTLDRRDFIMKSLPAGAGVCLGCLLTQALASAADTAATKSPPAPQAPDAHMTTEAVFAFHYASIIPVLQTLAKEMGREQCVAFLTKAAAERDGKFGAAAAKDVPTRDLAAFAKLYRDMMAVPPYAGAFTWKVTQQSEKVFEVTANDCLPAKLLRAMGASEIGYALECSGGDAYAKAFNPQLRVENPKNLMKGDDVCLQRFLLEA